MREPAHLTGAVAGMCFANAISEMPSARTSVREEAEVSWTDRNRPLLAPREAPISVLETRRAADEAQARYHELQQRNYTMIERRREAIARGDLMQGRRLAREHRQVILELRNAAHEWNLAVAQLLDAELNERGT